MEIWRARSFEKHLKAVLSSSSSSSSSSPRFSPSLHKTLLRRSFQTLASSPSPPPPPPLPHLSSSSSSSASSLSSLLFRRPLPRFSPPPRNLPLKPFSSVFSNQEIEWREEHHLSESCSGDESYQDHLIEVQQEKQSRFIPVKAYFLCTSIDLRSLQSQNAFNVIPPNSRATNYVVLRYYDVKGDRQDLESGFVNESSCHYMVVFQYGSIVLFNVSDHEADGYLKIVEKHASGLLPEMRKDDYAVVEKPNLETWMQGGLDYIVLKNLSIDGIRTIGSVLGQSIALDYYIRQVDGMVAEFTDINRGMEKTGTFTMKRKKLFQLVGKANSNLADVILKLGLFERSDIAWKNANYAQIWEYLRDEYELTQRFGNLDFKLKFVEHNIRFLQEILQNRKSDFLEWLIIILIGVEILISVYNIVREQL
ncbi:sporulation protein RMD1-like isoform X1 [Ananas comosus]|uniref:Sporulation protein RMD1-like isoform X1 n=1 Tax=Ananas comosus TaxID=4615 RepID=A0A6P5GRA9_ANACO|nr:sporulation protein RMD1-like isoform X1 [Ananas comosus]